MKKRFLVILVVSAVLLGFAWFAVNSVYLIYAGRGLDVTGRYHIFQRGTSTVLTKDYKTYFVSGPSGFPCKVNSPSFVVLDRMFFEESLFEGLSLDEVSSAAHKTYVRNGICHMFVAGTGWHEDVLFKVSP